MRSREATIGRSIVVAFDHGDDFFSSLRQACQDHHIQSAYIPIFVACLSSVDLVGTCQRLDDSQVPVWDTVQLRNVEAVGGGTLAYDDTTGQIAPHLHVAVGLKELSATGYTSHLLDATVQFLTELVIVEITDPFLHRRTAPELYDVPLLRFGTGIS
ncbi:PPC domain-containing DNA-binding protein [Actinoplanes sp. NPDC000266]